MNLQSERLEDYAEFKSVETTREFEVVEDKDAPTIEEVSATLERVVITFNEDIDKASISRYNVYYKNGSTKVYPESVSKSANNKVVAVFGGNNALPVYKTTLYVEDFADYSGNAMDLTEVEVKAIIDESRQKL